MVKKFHIGVKAVIVRDKRVLVLTEKDILGGKALIYDLPGGRIGNGESIEKALKRELKEELGIEYFSLGKLLNASIHPHYDKQGIGLLLLFYEVKVKEFRLKLSSEHKNYLWISQGELNKIIKNKGKLHKGIAQALKAIFRS